MYRSDGLAKWSASIAAPAQRSKLRSLRLERLRQSTRAWMTPDFHEIFYLGTWKLFRMQECLILRSPRNRRILTREPGKAIVPFPAIVPTSRNSFSMARALMTPSSSAATDDSMENELSWLLYSRGASFRLRRLRDSEIPDGKRLSRIYTLNRILDMSRAEKLGEEIGGSLYPAVLVSARLKATKNPLQDRERNEY